MVTTESAASKNVESLFIDVSLNKSCCNNCVNAQEV
jgi:hypothetical protein